MTHDLCQCLANGWGVKFPATYRGLAARKHLVVQPKMAALLSGFCLCTRSSAAERSCGNIRRRAHIISLFCAQMGVRKSTYYLSTIPGRAPHSQMPRIHFAFSTLPSSDLRQMLGSHLKINSQRSKNGRLQ